MMVNKEQTLREYWNYVFQKDNNSSHQKITELIKKLKENNFNLETVSVPIKEIKKLG